MSNAFGGFQNPSIAIQQSTPTPQNSFAYPQQSVLADGTDNNYNWSYDDASQFSTGSYQAADASQRGRPQQRMQSSPAVRSSPLTAQYGRSQPGGFYAQSQSVTSAPHSYTQIADESSRVFSNHLPTPTQTPIQESFPASYQNSTPQTFDTTMSAHMAMKQALMDQQANEDDIPGFAHSSRHSVSSFGDHSPATPHTTHGEETDDGFKVPTHGETLLLEPDGWMAEYLQLDDASGLPDTSRTVPRFERTVSDILQDELYTPMPAPINTSAAIKSKNPTLLSPFRNVVNERLQAANDARSQSPSSQGSRAVSPFRHGSPLAPTNNTFGVPQQRLGTAAQAKNRQKAMADAEMMRQQMKQQPAESKTISPKEAMLDYHESEEDSKMPLFPESESTDYQQQFNNSQNFDDASISKFELRSDQGFGSANMATSGAQTWTHNPRRQSSSSYTTTTAPPQSSFNFIAPAGPGNMHVGPFSASQNYRPTNAMASSSEETPEFPAHLTSMESSASEAAPPSSNNSNGQAATSHPNNDLTSRPAQATADTGTYTCTYHGCSLRFETPQKLQKHKREGHRQNANATTSSPTSVSASGSGMTSAALLARNSQAGPHRCDRINPTTGKPCGTVFSRPYDLTRHEDTIHNARKQKVRCALCVEEKTFSRNDALTRHLRVVHPEVDFPGKHRRRGGHD
ncbi:hypothetical protein K402DRAFT_329772 [Aulographum hederae CBS 113979]|uniref:C2H2-type domain-containing protein n=1 Tax=Aulographum hederae CBS 113979 TaxID=1176131 RepID=A0A6G1H3W2_9PEZI|nr:hypothetical protein K402DRAFT_329772 [Aulographum hederae CBS 113979]